jgi:pilus assembly protein Flp/PilA
LNLAGFSRQAFKLFRSGNRKTAWEGHAGREKSAANPCSTGTTCVGLNLIQPRGNFETPAPVLLNRRDGILLWHGPTGACQMSKVTAFLKDESGATAIEYGLIAAGISVVIIATVNAIGSSLNAKFDYIANQLK